MIVRTGSKALISKLVGAVKDAVEELHARPRPLLAKAEGASSEQAQVQHGEPDAVRSQAQAMERLVLFIV